MSDWPNTPLEKVVVLQRGIDLPSRSRKLGPYAVLGSNGPVGYHNHAPVKGPGVVIGRATNLGRPTYWSEDFWPLNTCLFVKDFLGNDPRFVYYLFESMDLSGFDSGSVQPMLNRNYIAKVPVSLPSPTEQRAIAGVLGALDDKIESNRRRSLIATELYQTEIRDMLLKLPDNGLGSLQQLSTFMSRSSERIGDVYAPEFSATVTGLEPRSSRFKKTLSAGNQKNKKIQAGDLVFGFSRRTLSFGVMRDPIGSVSPVYEVFRVHGGLEIAGLIEMQIRDQMHDFMDILKPGAREGQPIEANYLLNKKLVLPYNPVGFIISEQIKNLARVVELSVSENRKLTMLRDTLLPELLSGRLRVKDAESMMENV